MILCYMHHLTLSCGCRILIAQAGDGSFSRFDARRDCPGEKPHIMISLAAGVRLGAPPREWVFSSCPISSCSQPGGPWTEVGPPVHVTEDRIHTVHDTDRPPDGTYLGDLCCCSRTCPHGYWAMVGKAQIKMEQMYLFE